VTRRSRRAILAASGAGLAALAGCAGIDVPLGGEDEEREYDPEALARLVDGDDPTAPDVFPVRVTEATVERHYDRARELLSTVPERPEVPNGVIAERLREERERAAERLEERERAAERLEERDDAPTGLERLEDARYARIEAAEIEGSYRAAVGEVDHETVAERRAALRADRLGFETEWEYRGDDPARALVVHAELERLVGEARRSAEAWPPFPDDPRDDVFRVGEIVGELERGRAALGDATRLRSRYVEGTETRSYRSAITAAAGRLERRTTDHRRRLHDHLDRRASEAFERSVEGTPAEYLYHEARQRARGAADGAERARRTGDHATAALRSGTGLAALRTFGAVVDAVEAGEYGPPEDVDRLATAREDAVAALREAWGTEPVPASVELTWPARDALQDARYRLEDAEGDARMVRHAYANLAYAGLYAERVPEVVAAVTGALAGDG
jgi:hypothetical protein